MTANNRPTTGEICCARNSTGTSYCTASPNTDSSARFKRSAHTPSAAPPRAPPRTASLRERAPVPISDMNGTPARMLYATYMNAPSANHALPEPTPYTTLSPAASTAALESASPPPCTTSV